MLQQDLADSLAIWVLPKKTIRGILMRKRVLGEALTRIPALTQILLLEVQGKQLNSFILYDIFLVL